MGDIANFIIGQLAEQDDFMSGASDKTVTVEAEVIHKTEKALLCLIHDEEFWIPFSQIVDESSINPISEPEDFGELIITEWIAEKKGLI